MTSPLPAVRPMGPLQTAIYQRLTDAEDLGAAVYDFVDEPDAASWPYITIGDGIETPANSHDSIGRETTLYLHVWSRYRGFSEANAVASRMTSLLDHQGDALDVDGQRVVSIRFEFSQNLRDPDPRIRHVAIRFRVRTEQQQ